ncbi:unnamed protein product [Clonostachys solani]|uniref:Uncharacterized protein n=1 Tax=Clonostachys solani TaxID=160281 RepID=A0A9P0EJB7_9HYPO|nr:unnamed protein product [Clonostachys solani]
MRLFGVLAGLVLSGAFASADSEKTFDGMEVVDAKWNFTLTPGGQAVQLTGTIQQVYPRLLELNPTYEADWAGSREDNVEYDNILPEDEDDGETENPAGALSARAWKLGRLDLTPKTHLNRWYWAMWQRAIPRCRVRSWAQCKPIREGIDHLFKAAGTPVVGAGKCSQISCANNSAIIWCNVAQEDRILPQYNLIALGAQIIWEQCREKEGRMYEKRGRRCYIRGRIYPWWNQWFVQILGVKSCY